MYEEHSTYSSAQFLANLVKKCPFSIREIQTDNGTEFTNALLQKNCDHKSLFENMLDRYDIIYHRIRVDTPRHNGKVERSHRKDNEYFYASHRFYSFEDFSKQLQVHNRNYNRFPMRPLGWKSPKEYLRSFLQLV